MLGNKQLLYIDTALFVLPDGFNGSKWDAIRAWCDYGEKTSRQQVTLSDEESEEYKKDLLVYFVNKLYPVGKKHACGVARIISDGNTLRGEDWA